MDEQLCILGWGVSLDEKIETAIKTLKYYEDIALKASPDGYYVCFSGGKDSVVLYDLVKRSGVKHTVNLSVTGIDPPELYSFIRENYPEVIWHRPEVGFFEMVGRRGLPSRVARWCCQEYKENGGEGRVKVTGVRAAESARRAALWKVLTPHRKDGSYFVNPVLFWTDEDIWLYINDRRDLAYCRLYDEGWKRLGCVGCPMAGAGRVKEFERWPKYEQAFRAAARRYHDAKAGTLNRFGKPRYLDRWKSGDEMFDWWMSDNPSHAEDDCQMGLW